MSAQVQGLRETRIRRQFYLDSVALMRMSRTLASEEGVFEAAMMMGTPANLEILSNAGLLDLTTDDQTESDIGPGDLVITVRADTQANALQALEQAEHLLSQPLQTSKGRAWQPRSIRSAALEHPDANLVLISVPGAFAVSEARKAIRRGLHAMIFSDNVPLEDEAALKQEARDLGVLVMGPDCGTCVINGVPLAFANQLPRGEIGIVGASGTGIQEVSCLLAEMGQGISHAIGVGGRDMSSAVKGISTLMAIDALDADEATRHIVLVCKPPAAEVATLALQRISESTKPFTICFIGGQSPQLPANAQWANTLMAAAEKAANATLTAKGHTFRADVVNEGSLIRGLFCGGTLCAEAQVMCLAAGIEVTSNAAIPGVSSDLESGASTLIDLGADEYTQGKPHPMIDPAVRDQLLIEALVDSRTAVVLVDVVIGYGAHADPAGQLIKSLPADYEVSKIPIIASVTGTEQDPQVRSRQIAILQEGGVHVAESNAVAAKIATMYLPDEAG